MALRDLCVPVHSVTLRRSPEAQTQCQHMVACSPARGSFLRRQLILQSVPLCAGMRNVFGVDTNIDVIKHHGSTDPLILLSVLGHHGIPKAEVRLAS